MLELMRSSVRHIARTRILHHVHHLWKELAVKLAIKRCHEAVDGACEEVHAACASGYFQAVVTNRAFAFSLL